MVTKLGDEKLKSGESLEVVAVLGPDAEFADRVGALLAHKGGEWKFHIDSALRGETDGLETRYYLGLLDGVPVGNVMTVESLGIGILGHVFTVPEQRRKGICQAIMGHLMDDFRARGAHVLLLGTGYESPAYWIYHAFGFRSLEGGFMRYGVAEEPYESRWFTPCAVKTAPFGWRHWPLAGLLGADAGGELLRSAAWRLFGMGNLESPIVRFMKALADGRGTSGVVLETERGAVVGCATIHPTGGAPNGFPGVWLLDFFTHPNFAGRAAEMVRALKWPEGKVIAYVDTGAPEKAAALESCGFTREGTLRQFLRTGGASHDVWIYGTTSG